MWLWGLEPRDANAARSEISARKKIGPGSAAGAAALIYKCKYIYIYIYMCVCVRVCIYIIIRVYEDKNVYVYDHVNHVY